MVGRGLLVIVGRVVGEIVGVMMGDWGEGRCGDDEL